MAVSREGATGTTSPQYCPECGQPCAGQRYCAECGHAIVSGPDGTDPTAELPRLDSPRAAASPTPPAIPPAERPRSRIVLMTAAGALALAAVAGIAIILLNGSSSTSTPKAPRHTAAYTQKLSGALAPVVSANQSLSGALQAIDGSKKTVTAAQNATSQSQTTVTAARGAIGSLSGVSKVLSWVAGVQAAHKNAQPKSSPAPKSPTTPAPSGPAPSSPGPLTACDQNISVNSSTSCSFADNVFTGYAQDVQQNGGPASYDVYAYSPVTGQGYDDTCTYNPANQIVLCSHGSDLIQFPYWAAEVYQPG